MIKEIGLQDISTTIEEFARLDLSVKKVFITENKINGLSFPTFKESMGVFALKFSKGAHDIDVRSCCMLMALM